MPKAKAEAALLSAAIKLVESSNYRLTRPRLELLNMIIAQKGPFSAPLLIELLNKKSGCDPVTIYRTLPLFEELGIVERCDFSNDVAYYEISVGHKGHHHHHIVCSSCKKIEPLEFCILEGQEQLLNKMGYTKLTHRLEFTGICPACSK